MGDVNNDGHLDLVFGYGRFSYTTHYKAMNSYNEVQRLDQTANDTVMINDGNGGFPTAGILHLPGQGNTEQIALADMDNDGCACPPVKP